jgi:hypothetical protein
VYAFFFLYQSTLAIWIPLREGDAVISVGDDDAVPDRQMDEDIMTGRPLHQGTDRFQVEECARALGFMRSKCKSMCGVCSILNP